MTELGSRAESSTRRVVAHRQSLAKAGLKRVEVTLPVGDAELVRELATQLRAGGDDANAVRALLGKRVRGSRAATGSELVAFFRASPLTELELEVARDKSTGRPVDL